MGRSGLGRAAGFVGKDIDRMGGNSTPQTRAVLLAAQDEAFGRGQQVEPSHVLLAIIQTHDSGARRLIAHFVSPESLEPHVTNLIADQPHSADLSSPKKTPQSRATKSAVEHSICRVMERDWRWRTSDLLMGLLLDGNSDAAALLNFHGMTAEAVEELLESFDKFPD